jgi:hypothetical protein
MKFIYVIASEAWQSRKKKLHYYWSEDILYMRLPRFARNDIKKMLPNY